MENVLIDNTICIKRYNIRGSKETYTIQKKAFLKTNKQKAGMAEL